MGLASWLFVRAVWVDPDDRNDQTSMCGIRASNRCALHRILSLDQPAGLETVTWVHPGACAPIAQSLVREDRRETPSPGGYKRLNAGRFELRSRHLVKPIRSKADILDSNLRVEGVLGYPQLEDALV